MDSFLNFFTTRRLDEEFSFKFNVELKILQPAKVILNGLDDKIHDVSDEFDTSDISPYHKSYKEGNLYKIFPIKGVIQVNLVSEKLKKLFTRIRTKHEIHLYTLTIKTYRKIILRCC